MEENRTFSNALARLFGLLLAIIMFVLAVWFVIRQVNNVTTTDDVTNETGTVAVDDETNSVTTESNVDTTGSSAGESGNVAGSSTSSSSTDSSGNSAAGGGEVIASTSGTDSELPDTGPTESLIGMFALVYAGHMFIKSRKARNALQTVN